MIKYIRTTKVDKMYMWSTIFLLVFGLVGLGVMRRRQSKKYSDI